MPPPTAEALLRIVQAHLDVGAEPERSGAVHELIDAFVERVASGQTLAIDQLLNAVHLLTGGSALAGEEKQEVMDLVLRGLSRA
jgi:hypothetical protein